MSDSETSFIRYNHQSNHETPYLPCQKSPKGVNSAEESSESVNEPSSKHRTEPFEEVLVDGVTKNDSPALRDSFTERAVPKVQSLFTSTKETIDFSLK
jgi:hypothetical protein